MSIPVSVQYNELSSDLIFLKHNQLSQASQIDRFHAAITKK